jgi:hypothetical protein
MKGTEPFQPREKSDATKKKKYHWFTRPSFFNNASLQAATLLPSLSVCLKVALGITTTLYILNQSHLLPKPLSAVVSKTLFWPTLPITVLKRLGRWTTRVDETVLMGGAPFAFAGLPESLHDNYGVSPHCSYFIIQSRSSDLSTPTLGSWGHQYVRRVSRASTRIQ